MIDLSCENCGDGFSRYPSQVTDGRDFCSRECCNEWQKKTGTTQRERKWNEEDMEPCPKQGCDFESGSIHGLAAHWGMSHKGSPPWNKHECNWCGKNFSRPNCHIRSELTFCTYECRSRAIEAGQVRDYPQSQSRKEYGENWEEQRQKVIERDGGVCTYDGCNREECSFGAGLHVHHIKKLKKFDNPEEANILSNLRTLCAEHHGEIERKQELESDLE